MQTTESDETSRFKLAQIWQLVDNNFKMLQNSRKWKNIIHKIIKGDFNVNFKFTINHKFGIGFIPRLGLNSTRLKDYTPLHFLYEEIEDIHTFTAFIERGADYTMKNGDGLTALHLIIQNFYSYFIQQRLPFPFMNAVLSAHVKSQNSTNPRDDNGVSHFHGACMANHAEAVELFLANGASIEEAVNIDAPQYAGWTPLQFAAAFCSFQVAKILIERGANVNSQSVEGRSPIDELFRNRFTDFTTQEKTADKEQFMKLLLDKGAVSAVGLSSLHIACTLKDLKIAERLLDEGADIEYPVPKKSTIYPGYTALDFAAHYGMKTVKMLLKRGAKIDIINFQKRRWFRLYRTKYSLSNLSSVLSFIESLREMRLSDGQTKLLDLVSAMENVDKFKQFLQNKMTDTTAVVPKDSILWPGYSLLHLAVALSKLLESTIENPDLQYDKTIVEECLNRGLSVKVTDLEEQTPIHLAFYEHKPDLATLMFEHLDQRDNLANLVDKNNLSYLHIACYLNDESLFDRLLDGLDPNDINRRIAMSVNSMSTGSTPLHAATISESRAIAERLLQHGADLHATDADGMTSIHRLCENSSRHAEQREIVHFLLDSLLIDVTDRVVDGVGLSYLHVACAFGNAEIARRLLELGSDVNAVIKCNEPTEDESTARLSSGTTPLFLQPYANLTPLQIATLRPNPHNDEIVDVLLRHGADLFVNESNPVYKHMHMRYIPIENPQVVRRFFQVLCERDDMQKSMEERFGLTKLHIACFLKNEGAIRSALTDAVDVNARVRADSVIFPGCTPLHLLVTVIVRHQQGMLNIENVQFSIGNMAKMLIDHGADVTSTNAKNVTPIHVLRKSLAMNFLDRNVSMDLLLQAHLDFSVNPVNAEGMSHFHVACEWHNVEVIEKFLQQGTVNVNQPIDYFVKVVGGCTPLHLALNRLIDAPDANWTQLSHTVDVLLKYGADVATKDVFGDTPLHKPAVLKSPDMCLLEKLVSYGGDIKCENLQGLTPIEKLMSIRNDNPSENLEIFKKYGYKINSWNRLTEEGYIAKIFLLQTRRGQDLSENSEFNKFLESSDARMVDEMGRTAIHNAVAYSGTLHFGQTLEHMFKKYTYAIESFIEIGIDTDHRDKSGQTALHYAARMGNMAGAKALLACGADLNIVDNNGKSAFSYAMEYSKSDGIFTSTGLHHNSKTPLRLHIDKLQHLKIEVSQLNQNLANKMKMSSRNNPLLRYFGGNCELSQEFYSQVEMAKTLDIGTNSLTLFDFLSETGAVTLYCLLLKSEREIVDQFFASIDYNELKELIGLINLQSKKMKARLALIDSALSSLRKLLGFSVPGLCEQISRYLLNADLKNLIESATSKARKRKLSEISS